MSKRTISVLMLLGLLVAFMATTAATCRRHIPVEPPRPPKGDVL